MRHFFPNRIFALCIAFLLLCTSVFSTGCRSTAEPNIDILNLQYSTNSILYAEPGYQHGSTVSLRKDMQTTAIDSTVYAFETSISTDDRAECILTTETVLDALSYSQHLYIYVYKKSTLADPYVADHTAYTYAQDYRSVEYTTTLLLAAYGEYCNYGLAYGYAAYLCEQLYGTPTDTSALAFSDDFAYFDLNYLCFHPDFVSETDLRTVKSMATDFVLGYIAENGEENFRKLLIHSGSEADNAACTEALADYYETHGVDAQLSELRYGLGGKGCQYIVRCPYATICVQDDWLDRLTLLYPNAYDGFLNRDYTQINDFFTVQTRQMKQYQDLFGLNDYKHDLVIVFSNRNSDNSYYLPDLHYIEATGTTSLMHEYIHSLTYNRIFSETGLKEGWVSEGLAQHYDSLYSEYGNRMLHEDYNTANTLQTYIESLGRPLDLSRDMVDILNIFACRSGKTPGESPYVSGASFIHYLIVTFGEQEALQYLLVNYDFSTLTDRSFDDVIADWQIYLQENYGKYCE